MCGPPHSGFKPGGGGEVPHGEGAGAGGVYFKISGQADCHKGEPLHRPRSAGGGGGQLPPPHRPGHRAGDPRQPDGEGGERGHPCVRKESGAASHAAPHRRSDGAGLGSRFQDRLQAGGGGRHREGPGHGGDFPHRAPEQGGGVQEDSEGADPQIPHHPDLRGEWNRLPGVGADHCGAVKGDQGSGEVRDRQRGGGLRLLGQQAGCGGISQVRCGAEERRVHRQASAGPAGGTGEDRSPVYRRGAVPA